MPVMLPVVDILGIPTEDCVELLTLGHSDSHFYHLCIDSGHSDSHFCRLCSYFYHQCIDSLKQKWLIFGTTYVCVCVLRGSKVKCLVMLIEKCW